VTRWLRKKGLMLAERQAVQVEPDALEQATQTALRLGQLAHVDERGQVVSPPARRPGRRTGTGAHAGYSLQTSTVLAAGTGGAGPRAGASAAVQREARAEPRAAAGNAGRAVGL